MSPEDALAIAASFGVDVAGARTVPLPGGWTNEILRIDAPAGRFVVRRYGRLHVTRRAILFEHRIMRHAAAAMREIAPPLRDRLGRSLQRSPDGGEAAVFPYVDGETGARDVDAACSAAAVLAGFHRAMHDVHVGGGTRSTRFLGALPSLRERFQSFAADPRTARGLDWNALITAVGTAAVAAPYAGTLPVCVVHGDPNPGNVVRGPDGRVRALLDFDFAHETERVYDVGALLDEFARVDHAAPLALDRIAPIVDAYACVAPLSQAERMLVPDAMLRRAATMAWYVATRHGERVPGDIGGAPVYAARVAEIAAAAQTIRDAAGA